MASRTINATNSIILISVDGLFPNAQQLQGFAAEDIFETEEIDAAETSMGVDGKLSGGLIYVEIPQWYHLQTNSTSNDIFEQLVQAQIAQNDIFTIQGAITLPSLGVTYTMSNGILKKYPPTPTAHKTLQPRKYTIVWERISSAAS